MLTNNYYEARDQWRAAVEENSAKTAFAWGNVHSKGWGEIIIEDPIIFGTTFVNQPTVGYGFALDDDDQIPDPYEVSRPFGVGGKGPVSSFVRRLPRCSGGVLRWVQDEKDFYVGAHVYITVATADPMLAVQAWLDASLGNGVVTPPAEYKDDPGYDITHSFTFQALAIKEITA